MARKRSISVLVRPKKATWWLTDKKFFTYMLRELSALFFTIYGIWVSFWLLQLSRGEQLFSELSQVVWSPPFVVLSLIILGFSLYHSLTWFDLTSKVQPIRLGRAALSKRVAFIGNIIVWLAVSSLIAILFLG